MAVDTDYLDNLMKSIEPLVYPDGAPNDESDEEVFGEDQNYSDEYEKEVDSIAEKPILENANNDSLSESVDSAMSGAEMEEISVDSSEGAEQEVELDLSMSEEEIDALLNSAKNVPEEEISKPEEMTDLLSLLGDDESTADIKETLEKADNNIAVDNSALAEPDIKIPGLDDEDESEEVPEKKKGKKDKKSKKKKDKSADEGDGSKAKKPGFFARLLASLTEEDESDVVVPESSETGITDENEKILSELDSEIKNKKDKKKKKDKKGKGSKDASETEGTESDIREKSDDDDAGKDAGKDKKKKPKKEKKSKKEKAEEENSRPEKKLPKKRVRNTFILCLSILAAIILLSFFATDYIAKKNARYAFDNQEYETTYTDLYGMKLSDEDELIFNKSRIIMLLTRKADSYENYMRLGMKPEALNALLEGYEMSPKVLDAAYEYGVSEQVMSEYRRITDGLAVFGLSEDDAAQIVSLDSDVEYNKKVRAIAGGLQYQSTDSEDSDDASYDETEGFEDLLPEEKEFLQ